MAQACRPVAGARRNGICVHGLQPWAAPCCGGWRVAQAPCQARIRPARAAAAASPSLAPSTPISATPNSQLTGRSSKLPLPATRDHSPAAPGCGSRRQRCDPARAEATHCKSLLWNATCASLSAGPAWRRKPCPAMAAAVSGQKWRLLPSRCRAAAGTAPGLSGAGGSHRMAPMFGLPPLTP